MDTRYLLLDLDGTLTDPAPGITASIRHAVAGFGRSVGGDLTRFIGPSLRESFAHILQTEDPEQIEEAVGLYRERFATVGLYENAVYDGVADALALAAERGFALRVVTSKPKVYADRIVDHFGLRSHLPRVYGASLDGALSHKAELLAQVLSEEGLSPGRACMVGDREHDILGAREHGIAAIGVGWGYGSEAELRAAGADRLVHALRELVPAACALVPAAA